jgi:hypothetical protein
MQSRGPRSTLRRRRRQKREVSLLWWALLPIALIAVWVSLPGTVQRPVRHEPTAAGKPHTIPVKQRVERPIYPYSILAGGVYDAEELRTKLHADPVADRHYAPFDLQSVRPITLRTARLAYVSYRKGSNIYWTRKRISLSAGEILLTDGKFLARARCGNRVSDTPEHPVAEVPTYEPPELLMNIPEPPELPEPPQSTELTPPREPISGPPSVVELPLGPYPIPQFLPPPVAVVPEPDAIVLMGTVFLLCVAARWFRRRRSGAKLSARTGVD